MTKNSSRTLWRLLAVALALVLVGGLLAWYTQTAGGTITIRDVRFVGTNGKLMSALLYIPPGVTNKNKAPGILAVHGYINSRETQSGYAIEYARRGYVVLAMDQTGHGYSDPPAFANGFGGPDGLRYLRSLDIVDTANIGLEGHSMGGWTVLVAAGAAPNDYKSVMLQGSSTGTLGAPEGTAQFPRNLGLVFSQWDEFSALMWNAAVPKDIVTSDKLKKAFNTGETVQPGKLYGSIQDGTARKLYTPRMTHPWDHQSTEAMGYAMEWMQQTLQGGTPLPPDNQIWYWKELGTLLGLLGFVMFLVATGGLLLRLPFFQGVTQPVPAAQGATGAAWWVGAVLTALIPALSYFQFQKWGNQWFPANAIWPQNITTGIMTWAVLNALISLVLYLVWRMQSGRVARPQPARLGFVAPGAALDWGVIGKSALLAITIASAGYLLLTLSYTLFLADFRWWVVALKPMNLLQFRIFLGYLLPFVFYFLVLGLGLHVQMRRAANGQLVSQRREMLTNILLMVTGIVVLLLVQYIPLMLGGTLTNAAESLLTIVAIQFVPILAIVAIISTYFYRKTGSIWTGAFLNALFVTWYIVAGQATHFGF